MQILYLIYDSQVKTTNPKQYCVRPNIGVVLPGSTCDVTGSTQIHNIVKQWLDARKSTYVNSNMYVCLLNLCLLLVTMQAQKASPSDMQCKDKFLVQSVVAENGATAQEINAAMVTTLPLLIGSFFIRLLCAYILAVLLVMTFVMCLYAFMITVQ